MMPAHWCQTWPDAVWFTVAIAHASWSALYCRRNVSGMRVQPQGTPRGTVTSMCNSDVPSQAVYARFLMVVRTFTLFNLQWHTLHQQQECIQPQLAGPCRHSLAIYGPC